MTALLWKDYRINRAVLIVGLTILIGPYVVEVLLHGRNRSAEGMSHAQWGDALASAAFAAMGLSLLTISLLGANAFTSECADRSAEFLITLPPSRAAILSSKLVVAAGAAILIWSANLLVLWGVIPFLGGRHMLDSGPVQFLWTTSVLVFAAGWAASTLMTSLAGAWGVAIAVPIAILGALMCGSHYFGTPAQAEFGDWYAVASIVVAGLAFGVSSVAYVRRVGV